MEEFLRTLRPNPRVTIRVFLVALAVVTGRQAVAQTEFIPLGAAWSYLDDGSDQGTAWRDPAFDDSSWSSGPAKLGYGGNGEVTVIS